MKKFIFAMVSVMSFCVFAQRTAEELKTEVGSITNSSEVTAWWNSRTEDDIRVLADDLLSVAETNRSVDVRSKYCWSLFASIFRHLGTPPPGSELATEYDAKFADAGLQLHPNYWKNAPKCTEKFLVTHREGALLKEFPAFVQYVRKAIENKDPFYDICAYINALSEYGTKVNVFFNQGNFDFYISFVLQNTPKRIRRKLRERGMPIVVKDGVNHVQDAVDELSSALNAPKMAGVREWISKWFPDYKWIDVKWMSDEDLAKFKDDIFYGDIDFTVPNRFVLRSHLGVDAYNEFVKKFNN